MPRSISLAMLLPVSGTAALSAGTVGWSCTLQARDAAQDLRLALPSNGVRRYDVPTVGDFDGDGLQDMFEELRSGRSTGTRLPLRYGVLPGSDPR